MRKLSPSYVENVAQLDRLLRVGESFDIIKKVLNIGTDEISMYYIDGFVKDLAMQKLMSYFLLMKSLHIKNEDENNPKKYARDSTVSFISVLPYVETDIVEDLDIMIHMVMSGSSLILGSTFGENAIIVDTRTYPTRSTSEPESDRVMRGAKDGFVETLIFNTVLIRRRIRDTDLTMSYITIGKMSKTDVVVCYIKGRADEKYVEQIKEKLSSIKTNSLTFGHQSISECLIKSNWFNPFPKIRCTERPDAAAAQLLEGSVLILCDNSPEAMILPTTLFDFLQETNDFYSPPSVGTYIRIVRHLIMWVTLFLVPAWFLLYKNPHIVPEWLVFVLPEVEGAIPVIIQLLLVELVVDGLRMASINTPNMLGSSLAIIGGLILGDFAVGVGWLIPEVILYMAFVAIANFTQTSYQLGYALKFMRMLLLILTALFNFIGFIIGCITVMVLIATNTTVNKKRRYLYPLIPFNAKALFSLFVRIKKREED